MGVSQRLKGRFRKFLQRPGTTVDLAPFRRRLPAIEGREEALRELDDEGLTGAAGEAKDFTEICAIGREARARISPRTGGSAGRPRGGRWSSRRSTGNFLAGWPFSPARSPRWPPV